MPSGSFLLTHNYSQSGNAALAGDQPAFRRLTKKSTELLLTKVFELFFRRAAPRPFSIYWCKRKVIAQPFTWRTPVMKKIAKDLKAVAKQLNTLAKKTETMAKAFEKSSKAAAPKKKAVPARKKRPHQREKPSPPRIRCSPS
jgi:hypothetical protein